jgi:hypothetical protein
MRRLLGHLTWAVILGALFASIGANEAKAGAAYAINITIVDNTTHTTTPFSIPFASPNNTSTNPNQIVVSAAFNTAATGVSLTGLQATTNSTATSTNLGIQGTATVQDSSSDSYTITITTQNNGYTQPVGPSGTITQSESGTYTFTPPGTQTFQSWYNASNTPSQTGPSPGVSNIAVPNSFTPPTTASASSSTLSAGFSPFVTPYALTNTLILNISGNDTANNSVAQFQGSTTITAVPEPASLVMILTGMPMPLMVLGMLRRRKAQRKARLIA